VRHADADGLHARLGAAVDERLHARDERLAALARGGRSLGTGSPPTRRRAGGERGSAGTEAGPRGDAAPPRSCCQRPRLRLHSEAEPRSAQHRRRAVCTAGPAAARPAASAPVGGPGGARAGAHLQTKALGGGVLVGQERLEHLAPGQPVERVQLALRRVSVLLRRTAPPADITARSLRPLRATPGLPPCSAALRHRPVHAGACTRALSRSWLPPAPRAARLVHCGPSTALTHAHGARRRQQAGRARAQEPHARVRCRADAHRLSRLDALAQPVALVADGDVHVLRAPQHPGERARGAARCAEREGLGAGPGGVRSSTLVAAKAVAGQPQPSCTARCGAARRAGEQGCACSGACALRSAHTQRLLRSTLPSAPQRRRTTDQVHGGDKTFTCRALLRRSRRGRPQAARAAARAPRSRWCCSRHR